MTLSTEQITMIVSAILIGVSVLWIFIKLKVSSKLTTEQLEIIDFACTKGVEYAEQLLLSGKITAAERAALALKYAYEIVEKAGLSPTTLATVITGAIEAAVKELPSTKESVIEKGGLVETVAI